MKARSWMTWAGARSRVALCDGVTALREVGRPMREFVGFYRDVSIWGWFWDGASTRCFFDGPLLIMFAAAGLVLMIRAVGAAVGCRALRCLRGGGGTTKDATTKQKKE